MGKSTPTYSTYVTLHIYFFKLKYFQQNIIFLIEIRFSKTLFFQN